MRRLSTGLLLSTVLATTSAAVTLRVISSHSWAAFVRSAGVDGFQIAAGPVFVTAGALIVWRIAASWVGRCLLLAGAGAAAAALCAAAADRVPLLSWISDWLPWAVYALIPIALIFFPDSRLPSPRWRPVVAVALAGIAVPATALALASALQPGLLSDLDRPTTSLVDVLLVTAGCGILCTIAAFIASIIGLSLRWRTATGDERQQLKWLAVGAGVTTLALTADAAAVPFAWVATAGAVPAALTVAVLRYRLYDLDLFLNRSLTYTLTGAVIVAACTLLLPLLATSATTTVLGVPGSQLGASASLLPLALITGVLVVCVDPLRRGVQSRVDRRLRGHHRTPHLVLARVTRSISRTHDSDGLLRAVVEDVAAALRLPYVAIQIQRGEDLLATTAVGRSHAAGIERFPMTHQGLLVGHLLAARRSPGEPFTASERDLMQDVADQAGIAADAARLVLELRRSGEQLRREIEEERRRLRHDLHDSVGPLLAGMTMHAGAGRALTRASDNTAPAVEETFAILEDGLERCMAEVRTLINGLHRPPALDQVGLSGAVQECTQAFSTDSLTIDVRTSELPDLPAAVEVATYRIVTEALTNIVKHAHAHHADVQLDLREDALRLLVRDDGVGVRHAGHSGEGLHSMRQRAAELGGECEILRRESGGTEVRVHLPIELGGRA